MSECKHGILLSKYCDFCDGGAEPLNMNTTTPQPDIDELRELEKQLDNIVMAIVNFGHQVINEQHKTKKSYVYGTPDPLVISRVEAVPLLKQLLTTHTEKAVREARIDENRHHWHRQKHIESQAKTGISEYFLDRIAELQATNPVGGEDE